MLEDSQGLSELCTAVSWVKSKQDGIYTLNLKESSGFSSEDTADTYYGIQDPAGNSLSSEKNEPEALTEPLDRSNAEINIQNQFEEVSDTESDHYPENNGHITYDSNSRDDANPSDSEPEEDQVRCSKKKTTIDYNRNELGEAMKNPKSVKLPKKDRKPKKYTCQYCKKRYVGKIIPHIRSMHKNEPDVQKISSLPKARRIRGKKMSDSQKLAAGLMATLKNEGSFEQILRASKTDDIEVARRSQKDKTLANKIFCPRCKACLEANSIRKHKCPERPKDAPQSETSFRQGHNLVVGDIHPIANEKLRQIVAPMNNDHFCITAKRDGLIVFFANGRSVKYRFNDDMDSKIRYEMRLAARILYECQQDDPSIENMESIFDPGKYDLFIEATMRLGKLDEDTGYFEVPTTARDCGDLMKKMCDSLGNKLIRDKATAERKLMVTEFEKLFNTEFAGTVGKLVTESRTHKDVQQGLPKLPTKEDIQLVVKLATARRQEAVEALKAGYSDKAWKQLTEATYITILLFNRRRPSEVSKLLIQTYHKTMQRVDANKPNLSEAAKKLAQKYSRVVTRGKKDAKRVPILFDQDMKEAVDMIIKYRKKANVPDENKYVFGLPKLASDVLYTRKRHIQGSALLSKYAFEAGADLTANFTCNNLRKHIATTGISLNLSGNQTGDLSCFMGHSQEIHERIYQQPVCEKDILEVSQWLEEAMRSEKDREASAVSQMSRVLSNQEKSQKSDAEVPERDDEIQYSDDVYDAPVKTPGEKRPWGNPDVPGTQSHLVKITFFDRKVMQQQTISEKEIKNFILNNEIMRGRSTAQVRSHLQKLEKDHLKTPSRKRKSSCGTEKATKKKASPRNTIPGFIYEWFEGDIARKETPTMNNVLDKYKQSPSFLKYHPKDIQDFVKKAINFEMDASF
ncbi:hypothetical protein QAD02_023451 [Eretmocerus hayati]|uniref:Uncharacterized protein n=1 Tax=Eretmocerus hayati TaxID=131215 RepID=A0ACC2PZ81_9HYME|nr:hypothetical protein QAD02_023451 [Eretmocerus hayati]